jgi:hypothetical protein
MMPRVSFGMIVFNGDHVLRENLETLYPFAHQILIVEGPVKHYTQLGHTVSTDNTVKILKEFPDPENKIWFTQGQWPEKDEMCNAYAAKLTGDYVWHVDCDEIYRPEDIQKVFDYLDAHPECYSMSFRLRSFYGGFDRYISGFEENFEVHRIQKTVPGVSKWKTHRPPTMVWPPTGKICREMGHVNHFTTDSWGIRIYHYSHVFPKQVKAKMDYYKSWGGSGIISNYWDKLFLPWMRAETEEEKLKIEQPTLGVQEWVHQRRGPAFTAAFSGKHPDAVERAMPDLKKRIREEGVELGIWTK